jgi:hypothetical protein
MAWPNGQRLATATDDNTPHGAKAWTPHQGHDLARIIGCNRKSAVESAAALIGVPDSCLLWSLSRIFRTAGRRFLHLIFHSFKRRFACEVRKIADFLGRSPCSPMFCIFIYRPHSQAGRRGFRFSSPAPSLSFAESHGRLRGSPCLSRPSRLHGLTSLKY